MVGPHDPVHLNLMSSTFEVTILDVQVGSHVILQSSHAQDWLLNWSNQERDWDTKFIALCCLDTQSHHSVLVAMLHDLALGISQSWP